MNEAADVAENDDMTRFKSMVPGSRRLMVETPY
jgi:hypothetical protein